MKKVLSVILVITSLLTVFCACNKADPTATTTTEANEFTEGDYVYTILKDGTAKIIAYTGTDEVTSLDIPHSFGNGAKTTVIGEGAFKGVQTIGRVNFPRYLTTIEAHAFEGSSIKKAMMETSKTAVIGEYAFAECPNLVQVDFSKLTDTVEDKAFYLSSAIKVVTFRCDIKNINAPMAFDTGSSSIETINCVTNGQTTAYLCANSLAVAKNFPLENIKILNSEAK